MKEVLDVATVFAIYAASISMLMIGTSSLVSSFAVQKMADVAEKDAYYFNENFRTKEVATDVPAAV